MKTRVIFWSVTSALAGFLFGFDTVVISGAEQRIQSLWDLSPAMHGVVTAAALYGTVLGSLLGGWPTDRFGRKRTLIFIGLLYIVSAAGCAFAWDVASFVAARFIGGLGIGVSTVAAPLYISEIAPAAYRGRLAGMFQFNIVFGILVAYVSNALLADIGENAWRWMLGVAAVPSVIYTSLCTGLPESPRWLIGRKGDRAAGLKVLRLIEPEAGETELAARADAILAASSERAVSSHFWTWKMRVPILLAFLIAFFNQLSGINIILYFAPRILSLTGSEEALVRSVGIGITNLIFTFVGLWLIDRLGRRTLMFIGSFGYIISLGMCAAAFFIWAPQFKAASAAVDVKTAVDDLGKANPARVNALQEDLEKKKTVLAAATKVAASGAEPAVFPTGASPERVKEIADTALQAGVAGRRIGRADRACRHLRLHRRPRCRPGRGDLGLHFGNLPQPPSRRRSGLRQRDPLGLRRTADDVLPAGDRCLRAGLRFSLFLRYDGAATPLGEDHDARNEGRPAGRDAKTARH